MKDEEKIIRFLDEHLLSARDDINPVFFFNTLKSRLSEVVSIEPLRREMEITCDKYKDSGTSTVFGYGLACEALKRIVVRHYH